jgi:hypothetical protein
LRVLVRAVVIDSMGLSRGVLEGDLMGAVIGYMLKGGEEQT